MSNKIPNGKACTDCTNWSKCEWVSPYKEDLNVCVFTPSRFHESMISKFSDCIQENKRMEREITELKGTINLLLDKINLGKDYAYWLRGLNMIGRPTGIATSRLEKQIKEFHDIIDKVKQGERQ